MPRAVSSLDIQLERAIATRIAVAQEARLRDDGRGAFSVTYKFGTSTFIDFGSDTTEVIAPPPGLRGELKDLNLYNVTETFNTTSIAAGITIGIAGTGNAAIYASSALFGTLATDAAEDFALTLGATVILPADTDILVSFNASNNGTPAGRASVALTINFFV